MGVSGNSIAGKSFQSFAVSEELLAKVVEATKAGEKKARSSGEIQSFEVFYRGFRMNISIGRLYIIPPSVCNSKGDKRFPTALLYGCLVKTFGNGEEVGDMVEQRIGDTEFDEYSQADYDTIKTKLFPDDECLVLFAPNWLSKREYISFHYSDDQEALKNRLTHLVFSAYYNPAVSSAFDAIQTNVDTTKVDVTDITPKISYPEITESPLKFFPNLEKSASSNRKRLALTVKTADEVTKEVLDPQELDVFDSLDQALSQAMMPDTTSVEEAGEGGYKAPSTSNEIPRVAKATDPVDAKKAPKTKDEDKKKFEELQKKDACAAHEAPFTNVGPGTEAADAQESMVKAVKENVEQVDGEPPIGIAIDETGVARNATEEEMGKSKEASADAFTPVINKDKIHPGNLKDADVTAAIDEKKWGNATIPINFGGRKGGVPVVKAASYIADQIALELDDTRVVSSPKTRRVAAEREATLAKNRQKQADVPMDIDSIWAEITEDMGPAPLVDVESSAPSQNGEGSESKSDGRPADGRPRKSDVGELPEAFTSDKPEEEKAISEPEAEKQENDIPKPEEHSEEESKEASEVWRADSKTADFLDDLDEFEELSPQDLQAAQEAIDNDEDIIYDVAANLGQIVDNVKHMSWFVEAVARELDEPGASQDRRIVDAPDFEEHEAAAPAGVLDTEISEPQSTKKSALVKQAIPAPTYSENSVLPNGASENAKQRLYNERPHEEGTSVQCMDCGYVGLTGRSDGVCAKCRSKAVTERIFVPEDGSSLSEAQPAQPKDKAKAFHASTKKADTADNPYNMQDGNGAPENKKSVEKKDTSGPTPVNTKQANEVQPDVAEAKAEVVNPDTVDPDIHQETKSVPEAAKVSADVNGDMSEAKGELDRGAKADLADNSDATDTKSVPEAAKVGNCKPDSQKFDFGMDALIALVTEDDEVKTAGVQ